MTIKEIKEETSIDGLGDPMFHSTVKFNKVECGILRLRGTRVDLVEIGTKAKHYDVSIRRIRKFGYCINPWIYA